MWNQFNSIVIKRARSAFPTRKIKTDFRRHVKYQHRRQFYSDLLNEPVEEKRDLILKKYGFVFDQSPCSVDTRYKYWVR